MKIHSIFHEPEVSQSHLLFDVVIVQSCLMYGRTIMVLELVSAS